jgi:hypothetical protein
MKPRFFGGVYPAYAKGLRMAAEILRPLGPKSGKLDTKEHRGFSWILEEPT